MSAESTYQLSDRNRVDHGRVFMSGIQALARLPIEQLRADRRDGYRTAGFVSGYQGSPLGGYDAAVRAAVRDAGDVDVVIRPGLNEEYGATAVMGTQLVAAQPDATVDGVVGIWYGKAPGVDRAADALRHAVYAGASRRGGVVALVGDDPAAKSSTIPSSSAGLLADLHMPVLYPGDPAEALDLGRHGVALSRATGLWSALKIVADVADGTATVDLDLDRIRPVIPTFDGLSYTRLPDARLLTPHTVDLEREIYEVRHPLAIEYASANGLNHVTVDAPDAWIAIISSGITYREVREALAHLGLEHDRDIAACGIRLIRMHMPLPFDPRTMRRFVAGVEEVFVIEEKQPNVESLVKDALYPMAHHPRIVGKFDEHDRPLLPGHGALDADHLVPALRSRLGPRLADQLAPAPPPRREPIPLSVERSPFYCAGCPHNRSTQVPPGTLVGAGIGCHTMAVLMDPDRVGDIAGLTPMGNEGTQWIGMSPFIERRHFVQNLGDGTFFHSGQLAITAAIAAKVNITYKLLYNGAVAMTGGQHPEGQLSVSAITANLLRQGVAEVLITTDDTARYRGVELPDGVEVWHRDRLLEAQERLASVPGVTVLIHDQACAAEARRARKRGKVPTPTRRVLINHRVCEGCGDCGQVSNCLSVEPVMTPYGRKTRIDQTTCNLDYSCLEGDCPSFVVVDTRPRWWDRFRRPSDTSAPAAAPVVGLDELVAAPPPLPGPLGRPDQFSMRITGIGGTGVVTVAQVLGTAAMLDGYAVMGLDQIGLSQKAGPVVSDLRLTRDGPAMSNRLGQGQADLLLAFDQLVAASPKGLLTCDPQRTAVVGSTSSVPTGHMITHPDSPMPTAGELAATIAERTDPRAQHWADAQEITTAVFGDAVTANLFVVGMAVQAGALPIDPDVVERAIELNGAAVAANTAAFRLGRHQVADPAAVATLVQRAEPPVPVEPSLPAALAARVAGLGLDAEATQEVTRWVDNLIAFQHAQLAARYLDAVEAVAAADRSVQGQAGELTRAFADGLHQLTAYKDEYEVARLLFDPAVVAEARTLGRGRGRMSFQLHPPVLRSMGVDRKLSFGRWTWPLLRVMAKGKVLRGTLADPFRWAEVRRVERALPGEYRAAVERAVQSLSADTYDATVRLARLPDQVRGYEHLKLERAAQFRRQLSVAG